MHRQTVAPARHQPGSISPVYNFNVYPNKVGLVKLLHKLLGELGFMEAWLQQNVENVQGFLSVVKKRLKDTFVRNWNSKLNYSSRGLFYRNLNNFEFKSYLDIVTTEKFRYSLTRLRLSSHRLEVETGRWAKPNVIPFENRLCSTCQRLQDEFHFIFECSRYHDLRISLIPKYYRIRPSMFKLIMCFLQILRKCEEIYHSMFLRLSMLGNNMFLYYPSFFNMYFLQGLVRS